MPDEILHWKCHCFDRLNNLLSGAKNLTEIRSAKMKF